MVKELKYGQMEVNILATIKMAKNMVEESTFGMMVVIMMENGSIT